MEAKRNTDIHPLQLFLAIIILVLVLVEPISQFRVSAMQVSAEEVQCSGSMVECSDQMAEEEISMESETSRRIAAQAVKYITPDVLKRDAPVCDKAKRGAPYHSCLPPPSNTYHRGCEKLGNKVSSKTRECNGSIAECNEEYEFLMPSHNSKGFLEEKTKYISPGTLKPDRPACNGGSRGQSYSSSCLPPPSNPPSRGCSKYYRCRSDD
ncbi:unnamed protein product [Dovyalis caffra]|uniref:Uncharacterized protein n=1 Tax=Dovyalis caffra TaxID=77055 RepID=A0AAV1R395_9ROSI|nr:unnamed protein product [Dovyalis caffra]